MILSFFSVETWESAAAFCSAIGGSLPVFSRREEFIFLLEKQPTGSFLVYLGLRLVSKTKTHLKWMNGGLFDQKAFPLITSGLVPTKSIHCTDTGECLHQNLPVPSSEGKCSAIYIQDGFSDFSIIPIQCDGFNKVALFCFHQEKVDLVQNDTFFQHSMSDIKVFPMEDGFHKLVLTETCQQGWFRVGDLCIKIFHVSPKLTLQQHCGQNSAVLANEIFKNVTVREEKIVGRAAYVFDKTSHISKFWNMFLQKRSKASYAADKMIRISINSKSVCGLKGMKCLKTNNYLEVRVGKEDNIHHLTPWSDPSYAALWSFRRNPYIRTDSQNYFEDHFVMCEKPLLYRVQTTSSCSLHYLTCDDGTCIHDSLLCDGHQHCTHGEDEINCGHVCSQSQIINCYTECHMDEFCSCSENYFQCLSGGCIPLQKLCDNTAHCTDASDEPPTCVYIRPADIYPSSLVLPLTSRINDIIHEVVNHKCYRDYTFMQIEPIDYKISRNESNCIEPIASDYLSIICSDWSQYAYERPVRSIPIHHLCVYGRECNSEVYCANGFHLLTCKDIYCRGHFKCPSSYCVQIYHICNNICDCPKCEDESFCSQLSCPGMLMIERRGNGLCTNDLVIPSLHQRQIIQRPGVDISDEFPVYIHLQSSTSLQEVLTAPELVVYFNATQSKNMQSQMMNQTKTKAKTKSNFAGVNHLMHRMVSVESLVLSGNDITALKSASFITMSKLLVFDVSNNLILSLPHNLFCACTKLRYFFAQNNYISYIHSSTFEYTRELKILMLQSNMLISFSFFELDSERPPLLHLSSDLPRLCCLFEEIKTCLPSFPIFITCGNMLSTQLQVIMAWVIGLSTVCVNVFALSLLVSSFLKPSKSSAVFVVRLLSTNLSIADSLASICLLSYSIINVLNDGVFGVVADIWRQSFKCTLLEFTLSVSARVSLSFALYMSLLFAVVVPSIVPRRQKRKHTKAFVLTIWCTCFSINVLRQHIESLGHSDPMNYFCLPFSSRKSKNNAALAMNVIMMLMDLGMVIMCLSCYTYLFVYVARVKKSMSTNKVKSRNLRLQKCARKMAILILSTSVSWLPVIILQILVLDGVSMPTNAMFWCVLASFPANLVIDPILFMKSFFQNQLK